MKFTMIIPLTCSDDSYRNQLCIRPSDKWCFSLLSREAAVASPTLAVQHCSPLKQPMRRMLIALNRMASGTNYNTIISNQWYPTLIFAIPTSAKTMRTSKTIQTRMAFEERPSRLNIDPPDQEFSLFGPSPLMNGWPV